MEKINIGFDLGIASLGWSVYSIDQDKVLDKGVKLFYQANKAEDRRGHRALRRRYKRQKHRIERFDKYLKELGIEYSVVTDNNMLEKRINGINSKLELNEVINILRFFLKYRGYNPTADDTRENSYKLQYPDLVACELQKIILQEQGHYRGLEFPFMIEDFQLELNKLLDCQSKFHNVIDEDFIGQFFEIFNSRREFWEGPGGANENQLTPFGRYRNMEDLEKLKDNPDYRKFLYQELIKDCSIYLGEKSVSKDNFYAQRFNFLNDMLNLRFPIDIVKPQYLDYFRELNSEHYSLNLNGINLLNEKFLEGASIRVDSIFKKTFEIDISNLIGFRIDRDKKIEITKFDLFNKVRREFSKNNWNMELLENKSEWNKLCDIKAIVPSGDQREQIINKLNISFTKEQLDYLIKLAFTGQYHSFSEKALKVYIEHMENLLINSSTLEKKYPELINNEVNQFKIDNYFMDDVTIKMSTKPIDDLVASPQVKKSLRKAIKTFNQIKKKFDMPDYIIENIVIESNKEMLNDKAKRDYEINQLDNEKVRKAAYSQIEHLISSENNVETLITKQVLLQETNYKCIYCDNNVTIENMEIEHILPISKSADDSMANKVCSCHKCNHDKGNKTPYEFLSIQGDWEQFLKRVDKLKFNKDKLEKLTFVGNLNKYEKKFISRNLRDTAYATKELNNQFRTYSRALVEKRGANSDFMYNVITMPPQITAKVRRMLLEEKDRTKHYHHAFDATICAMYPTTSLGAFSNKIQNNPDKYWMAKSLEENVEDMTKYFKFTQNQIKELKNTDYTNTRMHTEVKHSVNSQLCNADINKVLINEIGTEKKPKTQYTKIEYISNIYALDKKKITEMEKNHFKDKAPKTLGLKYNDKPTYDFIKKIYYDYKDLNYKTNEDKNIWLNPFVHYCCEVHDVTPDMVLNNLGKYGIRPESKNGKLRPIIKRLNYGVNKTNPMLFEKKNVNLKNGNHLMLDSLSIAYTIVYENLDKGGFLFLPVYSICCNLKTNEPNFNHPYMIELKNKLLGNVNVKEVGKFRTNDYVEITKKNGDVFNFRVSGYDKSANRLEMKSGKNFTKSDISIKKIPVFGLGIYNMNLDE